MLVSPGGTVSQPMRAPIFQVLVPQRLGSGLILVAHPITEILPLLPTRLRVYLQRMIIQFECCERGGISTHTRTHASDQRSNMGTVSARTKRTGRARCTEPGNGKAPVVRRRVLVPCLPVLPSLVHVDSNVMPNPCYEDDQFQQAVSGSEPFS